MSFWDGKKVLVTGGGGFVGSHVVQRLLELGRDARVVVVGRNPEHARRNLGSAVDRVRLDAADLRSPEDCRRVCAGQEIVLHLAAHVGGVGFNTLHPATMFRDNMRVTTHMLEAAQQAGVERFFLSSSACVYPRNCLIPTPESEGFTGRPEAANEGYGWAKRMGEFEAMAVHKEFGLRVAIVRAYNCYGPRDHFDPETSHVIPALIQRIFSGENPVRVWGDGSQTRAFLYVEDFARGVLDVTERYAQCDPLNLGSDEEISIRDLVDVLRDLCGSSSKIEFDPAKPAGQPRRSCDTTRAWEKAGFRTSMPLREGLRRTVEWYRRELEAKPGHPGL